MTSVLAFGSVLAALTVWYLVAAWRLRMRARRRWRAFMKAERAKGPLLPIYGPDGVCCSGEAYPPPETSGNQGVR